MNGLFNSKQEQLPLVLQRFVRDLKPYLEMPINEIMFNKEKEFYLAKGSSMRLVADERFSQDYLITFCEQLANFRNQMFDLKHPQLATSIPYTQFRVHALHPSVIANSNIAINIRIPSLFKFPIESFKFSQKCLEKNMTYQQIINAVIEAKNMLIVGGTSSGKTSFANCLLNFIPLEDRVVTIEDSPELHMENPNQVNILVGKNEDSFFTYEQALNSAMRMTPKRLLLGELDTRNTSLFLRLSNTGHSGLISTLHANSTKDAFEAISMNMAISRNEVNPTALLNYFCAGIDYLIHLKFNHKTHEREITDFLDVKTDLKQLLGYE